MRLNRELSQARPRGFQSFRTENSKAQMPQITIRGDNNLINFGASGMVKVNGGAGADCRPQPMRTAQWPQQLLDAIRLKAAKHHHSNDELCDLAGRVLGRAVLTLERLSARELARVYEAVCATDKKPV
jgi:hypothetical protein